MDQVHVIRHKVLIEGRSVRSVARELRVSRNTVRKYLQQSEPVRREGPRARPVLEAVAPRIEEILEEWSLRTTRKQRVTGSRVHQQLVEDGFTVGVTTVRAYLAEKRRAAQEVYIPLVYPPGDSGQVDFFEVTVEEAGQRRKAWKFVMRLMYCARDFVWLYDRCDQVAFLDGHVRAFAYFGGVVRRLVYDNLTAAVKSRVGLERQLSSRFQALVSHYLFEPCFARPGEGHDKGGVESRGKGIRLQHLTPIPQGTSLEAISGSVLASIEETLGRRRGEGNETVEQLWAVESPRLRPLPPVPFEPRRVETVEVSRQAMIRVDGVRYSVPCHWKCLRATAYVGVQDLRVVCGTESVVLASERRCKRVVRYRHYLAELAKKPQAVRQVASELLAELGSPFDRLWQLLVERYNEKEAARLLSRLLGVVVDHGETTVAELIHEALERGDMDRLSWHPAQARPAAIAVPAALAAIEVESASARGYDELLGAEVAR
ncbi:MAG: IS21 family transposase [Acidobacteria bacterium]|nr:IS21 family transposase [Acidobacteriota bacterium]